ncbi:mnt isoform X4 [Musca autumnalis]|uniref:mnt isoform X4 n=1 Tax=Musca autumnalis TaxID=221902 RepID=UPI003CF4B274
MWQPSSPPPSHKNSTPRPMPTQPTAATSLANAFYGASAAAPLTTVIAAPPIGLVGNHDVKIPLNKLHVNDNMASSNSSATCFGATDTVETAPTAAQAAAAATAAAAAAAIYYNAATASTLFPSPASLGFMAHLQQYMKTRRSFGANADGGVAEVSHKPTSITPHPWPATTYDEFATNTTSKTTSNGHLLMAPTPGHATNMLMTSSSTHHSPTTSGLNGKLPATGALDLLPLDILTNTFMHLNALHLSHHMAGAITPVNSVLPSNAVESINTTTMAAAVAAAAAAATSKSYGQLPNSEAIAAAAMLSVPLNLTPPSPPAATTTTATTLPLHHPYFQMEHQRLHQQRQHQHLETLNTNSSAIKLTTSKPGESFQNDNEADYHDDDVGVHNYTTKSSSSSPMTGKSVITSTKSGVCNLFRSCNSPNTTTCNTSSSTNCDVRRALRKRNREREREREPHKRLKTGSPNSIHYRHHPLQQQQKQQHHHHHNHHLRGTPQYYNTFDVSSQEINTTTSQSPENQSNIAAIADDYNDDDDEEESLLPPPKKKWIRHYLNANLHHNNHHQMHVQNSNGNSGGGNSMLVDDIPPTQQHSGGYAAGSGLTSNSPPRQGGSGGSHYMHMINATGSQQAGSAGGNTHVTHVTPRRRTISSTSNGAGTREVHNKLEKNRRAHLKECYEQLKSQLSLKDEDRRKTSNLAILGEALKCVQTFKKHNQELEAEWEHLANDKINLQKRIVTLKRELGPKYEQIFSGIFPDIEVGSIPSERDTINDTHSLSSGRGSTLYSSSSSLSSGGSNGSNSNGSSNAMSSPVGAGLQTAMPTAISPVITKINSSNNNTNNSTSPITINSNHVVLQHQRKHPITTTIQAVAIPTQVVAAAGGGSGAASIAGGNNSPPIGSPNALLTFGGASGSSVPLSLTAKNISATAITRGSPTPSTPSPSPSSSSGVSSSSSLISSSPPINGVISNNGRNVTVNIPNGLKLQAANGIGGTVTAHTITGTIGNGAASAAATIIATSAPAQGVNNTNNAVAAVAGGHNQQSAFSATQTPQLQYNGGGGGGRKKNNSNNHNMIMDTKQHSHSPASEDAEQPAAKFLKVLNSTSLLSNGGGGGLNDGITANVFVNGQKMLLTNNSLMGNNNGAPHSSKLTLTNGKLFSNGSCNSSSSITTNELCRLPGGAELNILNNNNANNNPTTTTLATAFYHANGKITVLNGGLPPSSSPSSTTSLAGGPTPASTTFNGQTVTNGILLKDASSVTPLLLAAAVPSTTTSSPSSNTTNSLHFSGNFAQLLAAANSSNNNSLSVASATAGVSGHGNINGANLFTMEKANTKTASKHSHVAWRSEAAATTN